MAKRKNTDKAKVVEMRRKGATYAEIGKQFGITTASARWHCVNPKKKGKKGEPVGRKQGKRRGENDDLLQGMGETFRKIIKASFRGVLAEEFKRIMKELE